MGGDIEGQSAGVNKGSTFKFNIQAEKGHAIQGASLEKGLWSSRDAKEAPPFQIIIGYDNSVMAELIATQLRCFNIDKVSTGFKLSGTTAAIDKYYLDASPTASEKVILILDDSLLGLPYTSFEEGLEVLKTSPLMEKIRSLQEKGLQVVLTLDPAVYYSLEDVKEFGISAVLYKPFIQLEFFDLLRKLIGLTPHPSDTFGGSVFLENPIHFYDFKDKKILVVDDEEFLRKATALSVSTLLFLLPGNRSFRDQIWGFVCVVAEAGCGVRFGFRRK